MKTEDYISLEVAKLLKEKGYHEPCKSAYDRDGNIGEYPSVKDWNAEYDWTFSRPTLYEAQKWLRESKNLNIMVDFDESHVWGYSIHECNDRDLFITNDSMFSSYEEALNYGISEALKLI